MTWSWRVRPLGLATCLLRVRGVREIAAWGGSIDAEEYAFLHQLSRLVSDLLMVVGADHPQNMCSL